MTDLRPAAPPRPDPAPALQPERDTRGALSRLVEVLLDKGVYLDLDLVVTVAEVPLIAVDVRAAIAGVETMIEYGFLGPWASSSGSGNRAAQTPAAADDQVLRTEAWYSEPRSTGSAWRLGELVIERSGALRWQGQGDRRASLRLSAADVSTTRLRSEAAPGGDPVLEVGSASGTALLAGPGAERWAALLRDAGEDRSHRTRGGRG